MSNHNSFLTDLLKILVEELGRITGMFRTWLENDKKMMLGFQAYLGSHNNIINIYEYKYIYIYVNIY